MDLVIRPATLGDADVIVRFNAAMALETESLELDMHRLIKGVRAVLSDPAKGFYLVAETAGRIAGQTMVTFEWSDWRNANFWWIQSVYIDPAFRAQGVFKRLYAEIERRAWLPGVSCGLRLYVEGANESAQRTYERLGMRRTGYRFYEVDFVLERAHGGL